jgi:hypothetical protein
MSRGGICDTFSAPAGLLGEAASMPLELAAVIFDGAFTADRELNNLRVSRLDPWVGEVAVLEHHEGGMYFTRATGPDYGGSGDAVSRRPLLLTGILIGAVIDGAGALEAAQTAGAFGPLADQVRALLPADTSALMLVAGSATTEEFVSAVAPRGGQVGRREVPDEVVKQLRHAASN